MTLDLFTSSQLEPGPSAPRRRLSIAERFEAFRAANPHVMAEMLRLVRARLDAGEIRISAKGVWEQMRVSLRSTTGAPYKLDNSLCSMFADACIEAEPRLARVIERRNRSAR